MDNLKRNLIEKTILDKNESNKDFFSLWWYTQEKGLYRLRNEPIKVGGYRIFKREDYNKQKGKDVTAWVIMRVTTIDFHIEKISCCYHFEEKTMNGCKDATKIRVENINYYSSPISAMDAQTLFLLVDKVEINSTEWHRVFGSFIKYIMITPPEWTQGVKINTDKIVKF